MNDFYQSPSASGKLRKKTRVLLIGAGGYGETYAVQLAGGEIRAPFEWVGVVDPFLKNSAVSSAIVAREGIPVFETPEDFFARAQADLTIVSTPIPLHARHCVAAMEHGSDVLLEKPIAGSSEIAREILAARDRLRRRLFLGYQWCYDDAMLRLKRASDRGDFGRPLRMRSLVLWPRGFDYYARNGWAGRAMVNASPVYDSVSSNATAHYLFNMLWLAGRDWRGAAPVRCDAFTGRANDIETFDTAVMRFALEGGAEILHVASHAAGADRLQEPMFLYEYEDAVVQFGGFGLERGGHITALLRDGRLIDFGESILQGPQKLEKVLLACGDPNAPIVCPGEAALQHTLAIEMARLASPEAHVFQNPVRGEDGLWVEGLADELVQSYCAFRLPQF